MSHQLHATGSLVNGLPCDIMNIYFRTKWILLDPLLLIKAAFLQLVIRVTIMLYMLLLGSGMNKVEWTGVNEWIDWMSGINGI